MNFNNWIETSDAGLALAHAKSGTPAVGLGMAWDAAWVAAIEAAAQLCEQQQTQHGARPGGSDGPDAARRACAVRIRELKTFA